MPYNLWRIQWKFNGKINVLITENEEYFTEVAAELLRAENVEIKFCGKVLEHAQLIDF